MSPHHNQGKDGESLSWLAEIYRTYAAELQRYLASKVSEPALAEDLTSTVFLKALRWLRQDQSSERIRGWLYATARTTLADYWQIQGQYEIQSLDSDIGQWLGSEERAGLAHRNDQMRVQRLLNLLSERERNILTLRYLQGYSAAEIAEVLGTSPSHIRVLQLRALRRAAQLDNQQREVYSMAENPSFEEIVQELDQQSQRVLELALQEAQTLKHYWIGTEHLLWGLASEGSLNSFFAPLDILPERIHAGIVFIFDRATIPAPTQPPASEQAPTALSMLTPRTKHVLILAHEEARNQGEKKIRPVHLLLGMTNESEGIGAGLLRSLGANSVQIRAALVSPQSTQSCTFCGRSGSQIRHLFPAPTDNQSATPLALICNQCVERFHAMLQKA